MHLIGLVESSEHVCCRYRLRAFLPALRAAGHQIELVEIPRNLKARWQLPSRIRHADGVILLRRLLSSWEIQRIRRATPRLIFDIDDAVWLRDSYSPKGLHDPKRVHRFTSIVRCADLVVCGNHFLQQQVEWFGAKATCVIPTCVEPQEYPLAEHSSEQTTLVWIGSSATLKGLEQEKKLWESIGQVIPNLRWKLICDRFIKLDSMEVIESPWSETSEKIELASSSIGIGWIPDDDWSRGKCGLKVLQYLAAGLPVVTNPVGVHPEMVIPNHTGFLAQTPQQWIEAIQKLSQNPELRRTFGHNGRQLVEERYSVTWGGKLWVEALEKLSPLPSAIEWFFAPDVPSWELNLEREKQAGNVLVIKHGKHRTVYKVSLANGQTVYWKHCRLNGPRAWWREVFRGPKARLEFNKALELRRRNIHTIEPLAWGKFKGFYPKGSFLITKELEQATPLDEFLQRPLNMAERITITHNLADFFAQLHREGITHPDPHPGNLLVSKNDLARFYLIDLHDLEFRKSLSLKQRIENLVLLNRWFALRTTRTDRLRFWKRYQLASRFPTFQKHHIFEIEQKTARSNFQLWKKRNLRTLGNNRSFQKIKCPPLKGHVYHELAPEVLETLLSNPDAPFQTDRLLSNSDAPFQIDRLLKNSRSSAVVEITFSTSQGKKSYIWKKFKVTHWYDGWINRVRTSPVLRAWCQGHALAERGLPTPVPYLVLQRYSVVGPQEGYILYEKISDAPPLNEWWQQTLSLSQRRDLLHRLGILVRQMHERGFLHRDLKAPNILVRNTGELVILDVVGAQSRYPLTRSDRHRDLGRLAVSSLVLKVTHSDRLRLLSAYLGWGLYGIRSWKSLWYRLIDWVNQKLTQNQKKGRPLT